MSVYTLPKVKNYVEAIIKPIVKALTTRMDAEMKKMDDEIQSLKARVETLENEE